MKTSAGTIRFFVPGVPVPKARARVVQRPNGSSYAYTPKKTQEWEEAVAWQARIHVPCPPIDGPIRLSLIFYFPRPRSVRNRSYPDRRPDLDNIIKSAIDALNGIAFVDDGRIVELSAKKQYGDPPGVEIEIEPI